MPNFPTVKVRMPWSPRSSSGDPERDADAEILRNLWRHQKILPPTSFRRNLWDWILIVLVVFSCVQIPLVLAFRFPDDVQLSLSRFDLAVDIIFGIDIILIFNTSYYADEELVSSRKGIFKHYLLGWFVLDFSATFPWDAFSKDVEFLRLIRLLRLTRVAKKMDTLKGGMGLRFFYLMFWWMLIAHWIACIWWAIGALGFREESDRYHKGLPAANETSWLVRIPPVGKAETGFSSEIFRQCVSNCLAETSHSRMECMSNSTCDDNNMNPDETGAVFNAWWSSFYWAFTMLMKTPFVGPDTVLEKAFSCITVVLGAIIFALLLGQVTNIFMTLAKAGAQLRDQLVTFGTFAATRHIPSRMHNTIRDYVQSEFRFTKGMDTVGILEQFPTQIKGDVLMLVYASLLEHNPTFLRSTEQLKRQILSILKPAIALKKANVLSGHQFGCTLFVLLKGTLQVSQAPPQEDTRRSGEEKSPKLASRSKSMGKGDMKSQLTRMNTKGFKDKLKVRMLEKPGSLIPYAETIHEGPKPSLFSIFAVTRCKLFTFEATDLARVLKSYPPEDSRVVTEAIRKDFTNLVETLKMKDTLRESRVSEDGAPSSAKQATNKQGITENLTKMESQAQTLITEIDSLQRRTKALPLILKELYQRMGVTPQAERPGASCAAGVPTIESDEKKADGAGGFFTLGGGSSSSR